MPVKRTKLSKRLSNQKDYLNQKNRKLLKI